MKRKVFLIICILFFLSAGPAHASVVAERLQDRYETIESFQADFVQILTNAATREQEERVGRISFQKPMNVHWESTSPEKELMIIDGETVWNYFPEEDAVYRYKTDQILTSGHMFRIISGQAGITEDFRIEDLGMENGLHKIRLVPRYPEPDLVMAYIWSDDHGLMHRILLIDFFGNSNELRLKDVELNPEFDKDFFRFEPPAGVDIIENQQP